MPKKKKVTLVLDDLSYFDIANMSVVDVLSLWHDGKYHTLATEISQIQTCDCGSIPKYVRSTLKSNRFQSAELVHEFLCEDCFKKRCDVDGKNTSAN